MTLDTAATDEFPAFIDIHNWSPFCPCCHDARLLGSRILSALSIGIWTPFPRRAEGGEKDHHIRLPVMHPIPFYNYNPPLLDAFGLENQQQTEQKQSKCTVKTLLACCKLSKSKMFPPGSHGKMWSLREKPTNAMFALLSIKAYCILATSREKPHSSFVFKHKNRYAIRESRK